MEQKVLFWADPTERYAYAKVVGKFGKTLRLLTGPIENVRNDLPKDVEIIYPKEVPKVVQIAFMLMHDPELPDKKVGKLVGTSHTLAVFVRLSLGLRRPIRKGIPPEILKAQPWETKTNKEIAKELGLSLSRVRILRKKYGKPRIPRGSKLAHLSDTELLTHSAKTLAEKYGVHYTTVNNERKRRGFACVVARHLIWTNDKKDTKRRRFRLTWTRQVFLVHEVEAQTHTEALEKARKMLNANTVVWNIDNKVPPKCRSIRDITWNEIEN